MTDWMHCNKCFLKYGPNVNIFLTECGHLFCHRCAENLSKYTYMCKYTVTTSF